MRLLLFLMVFWLSLGAAAVAQAPTPTSPPTGDDPFLWLEDVTGNKALEWVKARNAETIQEYGATPAFHQLEADVLKILDSRERIPGIAKMGAWYYNFWRDAEHPRGLWRRTTLEEYRKASPKWDVILDLDALSKAEKENWVWQGADVLRKGGFRHCLISLSRGGADASVVREFDIETRSFVKSGFQLPESKGSLNWIDIDHVYVSTDFGAGSLTDSGYPRIVKLWKRGTPLEKATVVFEGKTSDVSVGAYFDDTPGFERHWVSRGITTYTSELYFQDAKGKLQKMDIPLDAGAYTHREWLIVEPRTAWTTGGKTYEGGSLLTIRFSDFLAGKRDFAVLFKPTPTRALAGASWTRNHMILNVMEDVKNQLSILTPGPGEWKSEPLQAAPAFSTVSAWAVDPQESEDFFMSVSGYLTPSSTFLGHIGGKVEKLKELPSFFDTTGLEVSQHFATSKDGTRVPYFQIAPKNLVLDGSAPTLLYGYGGFEVSQTPFYSGAWGRAWMSQGGVCVIANIRGGAEYGPRWHQAALKQNRLRAYEDFAAVAQDLATRKVTSAQHLGAMGGSNGGLLMGNMITLYPELFHSIVCQVPLLDMRRYSRLLAGASWMGEYGDPDKPEEWAFIQTFSPYHNLKKDVKYPTVLFTTSTRDDRVHPGHARKMMARMMEMGCNVKYYENIEGGHGGAANNQQRALMTALEFTFLWQTLK